MTLQLAIVASGNGTNAQAIIDAVNRKALDASIRLILSNRPQAKVLERARLAGIPALCLEHTAHPDRSAYDAAMVAAIRESGADTVALAGYMRLLTSAFLHAFPGRVLNIHPALLPAFPGVHGAAEARDWGVTLTGCTVHFVDEELDHGAIIIQAAVPCMAGEPLDDLLNRIHAAEHRIYPQALQWLAAGRIRLDGRTVHILPASESPAACPESCLIWPPLEEGF